MPKRVPSILRRPRRTEARELSITQLREIHGHTGAATLAGPRITPDTALTFSHVFEAVNCLSTDVATLPLNVFRSRSDGGRDRVPDHPAQRLVYLTPDEETTARRFRQALMAHVLTHGNGYAEIVWSGRGEPMALHLLCPRTCYPDRTKFNKRLFYHLDGGKTLPPYKVLHVAGLGFDGLKGYSPVTMARQAIALGIAAEGFGASFFGNGSKAGGVLRHPGKLKPEARSHLRESWQAMHGGIENAHRVAILEEGMEFQQISIPPEDAQFLATRQFQRTDIAALFRLPPHKIGDYTQSHLANIEASNLDYLVTTLAPWLVALEDEFNYKLLTAAEQADGYYVKHNANALLRGNLEARTDHYVKGLNNGWFTVNDVLALEDANPITEAEGGDRRFRPANLAPLDQEATTDGTDASNPSDGGDPADARAAHRLNGHALH